MSPAPNPDTRPASDGKKIKPEKSTATGQAQVRYAGDGRGLLLNIALFQSLIVALVVGFLLYFTFFAPPAMRYFAALPTGQIIPMVSLDRPVDTDPVVLGWTADAASEIMTFNYRDYNERVGGARRFFTDNGWASFTEALRKSDYIQTVTNNKQMQSAVPREAPRIINRCTTSCNPYFWEIQMPLLINVESQDKKANSDRMLTLTVVRVSPVKNPAGIQIDKWREQ